MSHVPPKYVQQLCIEKFLMIITDYDYQREKEEDLEIIRKHINIKKNFTLVYL